jgi:hypothetical protein
MLTCHCEPFSALRREGAAISALCSIPQGPELPKSLFAKEGFQGGADAGSKTPLHAPEPVIPAKAGIHV